MYKLLEKSKIAKSLGNIPKVNNKLYPEYLELLNYTQFLPENSPIRERLYYVEHKLKKIKQCFACNNKAYWEQRGKHKNTYKKYCKKCSAKSVEKKELMKQTMLDKYGDENYNNREKQKQTMLDKYGDENYNNREKQKQTMLDKYSVEHNWQNGELREKQKQTMLDKYGVEHNWQNGNLRDKINVTKKEKYGDENYNNREKAKQTSLIIYDREHHFYSHISKDNLQLLSNKEWLTTKYKTLSILELSEKLNVHVGTIRKRLAKFNIPIIRDPISKPEKEIIEFIKSIYNGKIITNTRSIIFPFELDIYIPEYNFAIEFDGIFWHSDLIGKDKNYHYKKTKLCSDKNIKLFHIFENEWSNLTKRDIWCSMITNALCASKRIYARKCIIKEISYNIAKKFQEEHHLQGITNASVRLGLYYQEEIVALMTFSKSRYNKHYNWELMRFCNKKYYTVVGGASKLFMHFKKHYNGSVISYADLRRSSGGLYKQLNFKYVNNSTPNYFYFNLPNLTLHSRITFQKHKLPQLLNIFDENLTEWENMQNNGWNRIWDCGSQVWIYN